MGKMPGCSGLQRALTKRGREMHTRPVGPALQQLCRDPDFRVPGAPHTSGTFLTKVHGVTEGTVSLEGLHQSW